MQSIPLSQVKIPENRQRKEFDPETLMELTESIRDRGLLQAPVLRKEGDNYYLVCGERRIRAIQDLWALGGDLIYNKEKYPEGSLPYTEIHQLDILSAMEAELDENLRRENLTWQEHAAAIEMLKELREKQNRPASPADIALEVTGRNDGSYQGTIRKELIVAKHLNDPDVKKAKTLDEGYKILQKKEESKRNQKLAQAIGQTFSTADHKVYHTDCLPWMEQTEERFDIICTDPLYGMGADKFGDGIIKQTSEHRYDDSYENWKNIMSKWVYLAYRVTKPEAHAYVFCDFDRFHELKQYMQEAGWYVFRTPFICVKTGIGRVPLPDRGPSRQYELCLYAIKGNKPTTHIYPDVITTSMDSSDTHGAKKPVALYQNLLQRSVRPGDKILDCFAGTGPVFQAAHNLKCYATGLELEETSYGVCLKRLQAMAAVEGEVDLKDLLK